ncbi:MAG: DUF2125 domain-containing protein [Pseudomonadota bacterium]
MARILPAVLLAAFATPAWADLTASEAWESFQLSTAAGSSLTWENTRIENGTLTVEGTVLESESDEAQAAISVGTLTFTEGASGTVALGFPAVMPVRVTFTDEFGEDVEVTARIETQRVEAIYSGDSGDITFDLSLGALQVMLVEVADLPPEARYEASATAMNLTAQVISTGSGPVSSDFTASIETVESGITLEDPVEGLVAMGYTLNALETRGQTTRPARALTTDALLAGPDFRTDASLEIAGSEMAIEYDVDEGSGAVDIVTGKSSADVRVDAGRIATQGNASAIRFTANSPDLPLPASFLIGAVAYELDQPARPEPEPQPFSFDATLSGITLDDVAWNSLDPSRALPREPGNVALNLEGSVGDGLEPFGLRQLTLNGLTADALGAAMSATGSFTFNAANQSPDGALNIRLLGLNTLLETLFDSGIVNPTQAFGILVGLGSLMQAGAGEDEMTSQIELGADGSLTVNGQRFR